MKGFRNFVAAMAISMAPACGSSPETKTGVEAKRTTTCDELRLKLYSLLFFRGETKKRGLPFDDEAHGKEVLSALKKVEDPAECATTFLDM